MVEMTGDSERKSARKEKDEEGTSCFLKFGNYDALKFKYSDLSQFSSCAIQYHGYSPLVTTEYRIQNKMWLMQIEMCSW